MGKAETALEGARGGSSTADSRTRRRRRRGSSAGRTGIGPADLDLSARVPLFALFAGLKRASLVDLLTDASPRCYPCGAVLFLQDEPATRFYIVLEGWVKLYHETRRLGAARSWCATSGRCGG